MSILDYRASQLIALENPPFYAIIMAAMRKGDTANQDLLKSIFPYVWDELVERYNAPGGLLPKERAERELRNASD